MELKNQVCSFELSKQLKELGVKEDSLFVWITIVKTGFNFIKLREEWEPNSKKIGAFNYPAFTVAELGEMLPESCDFVIMNHKDNRRWDVRFSEDAEYLRKFRIIFREENEADARAKMLIYLLENGLIKNE